MLAALMVVVSFIGATEVASPRPTGWVTDQASVLDAAAEARINALVDALHAATQIELAVVTVTDVRETPKRFATTLFNHWRIGAAQTNTGVLVLLVMGQRRLEIETGTGIEAALPAAWLAAMQARTMVPRFKAGDFGGGLVAGIEQIVAHLNAAPGESTSTAPAGEYLSDGTRADPDLPTRSVAGGAAPASADDGEASGGALVGGGLGLVGLGGGGALLVRRRRRQRTCTTCVPPRRMLLLDEVADDQHLEPGQLAEERLRSAYYDVLICAGCQGTRTRRRNRWFSGYDKCSRCDFKTAYSTSRTTVHATYDHGGQVEVTEACEHCRRSFTYSRMTAVLTRASSSSGSSSSYGSSSSSGSSGFGGGSSSGGGAGSSW